MDQNIIIAFGKLIDGCGTVQVRTEIEDYTKNATCMYKFVNIDFILEY